MTTWIALHPDVTQDHLGLLPYFISESDPRPVSGQLDENYAHGGGWRPFGAGEWKLDRKTMKLRYPGDPALKPLAMTRLRDEEIYFYDASILLVLQKDGSFEVTRVD